MGEFQYGEIFQTFPTYNYPTEGDEEAVRISKRIGYLDISVNTV